MRFGDFWACTHPSMHAMGRPWLPPMASRTGSSEAQAGLFPMEGLNKQVCRLCIGAVHSQFTSTIFLGLVGTHAPFNTCNGTALS